jgi:hypothetical protein
MKYLILIAALLATVACNDKKTEEAADVADVSDVAGLPVDATAADVSVDATPTVDVANDVTLSIDVTLAAD